MSDYQIDSVYIYYHNIVKNTDFGKISSSQINRCFKEIKVDKNKAIMLSLRIKQ